MLIDGRGGRFGIDPEEFSWRNRREYQWTLEIGRNDVEEEEEGWKNGWKREGQSW